MPVRPARESEHRESNTVSTRRSVGRRRSFVRGVTLIEIMIVVFIIGLVSATVIITFGGDSRDTPTIGAWPIPRSTGRCRRAARWKRR